ncbi:hypothetical protein [Microbacterium maritypicum]|uniref:hypothetical protein n=1 Tax=Microbacterium maritypicum TaxID=33918 RepID=UPI0037F20C8E
MVTCSALRRVYRDRLAGPSTVFIHLSGQRDTIAGRLSKRTGHYMPSGLLGSQFEALEPLGLEERGITIDAAQRPEDELAEIIDRMQLRRFER